MHVSPLQSAAVMEVCEGQRVLICYFNSKKIVGAKSSEEIECAVSRHFSLAKGDFLLQYYDDVFEEWVDIPENYVPADKEKIMVLPRSNSGVSRLMCNTAGVMFS